MKILVTGAAGFLGSHLVDYLLQKNHTVVGIDNFFRGKKENLPNHPNFIFYERDMTNSLESLILDENPEIIFHYAAINGTQYFYDIPNKVLIDNIKINENLLNACKNSNVKKIIYASSSEVYGPTPSVPTKETECIILDSMANRDSYASSKALGEFQIRLWCEENNVDWIIVRPFNTYGDRMVSGGYGQVIPELIKRLNDEYFFIYGDGSQTRSFCFVDDHVNIVYKISQLVKNEILNIGFDSEISILELAKLIGYVFEKKLVINHKPAWKNDTKWRKPSLEKLKKYIGKYQYIDLQTGLKILKNGRN